MTETKSIWLVIFKVVVLLLAAAALILNALGLAPKAFGFNPTELYVALLALGLFTMAVVSLMEKK